MQGAKKCTSLHVFSTTFYHNVPATAIFTLLESCVIKRG